MPFTVSHAVAYFPFRKLCPKYLSLSGLIMGAMAPDFEYFLRMTMKGVWGHTWTGMFLYDLPISLAIITIFHLWIRDPLIRHLPPLLLQKYRKNIGFDWLKYFRSNPSRVIGSVLLGTITHFMLDAITHEVGYIYPIYINFLMQPYTILGHSFELYNFLQIGLSVVGLLLAGWLIISGKIKALYTGWNNFSIWKFWLTIGLLTFLIILIRYLFHVPEEKPAEQLIVISMSALMLALLFTSLMYKKVPLMQNKVQSNEK